MAFSLAREALPYAAIIGADFAYDWAFVDAAGEAESLAQVVGVSISLTRQGLPAGALAFDLTDSVEIVAPNVVRLKVEARSADPEDLAADLAFWPAGRYRGGIILHWADGSDEAVMAFEVVRSEMAAAGVGLIAGGAKALQRAPNLTRIIRTAAGRLSSIVPQITLTELAWPETTAIGEQVAVAVLSPAGAAVTYSLVDDAGGAVALTSGGILTVAAQPDSLASSTLDIVIQAAVTDGDTVLRAPITVTLQYRARGRIRFNNSDNSLWLGIA